MSRCARLVLILGLAAAPAPRTATAQSTQASNPWTVGADVRVSAQPLPVIATGLFVSRELIGITTRSALELEIGALARSKDGPGYACPAVPGAVCNDERTVSAIGDALLRARATFDAGAWQPTLSVAAGAYATRLDGYATGPVISGSPTGAMLGVSGGVQSASRGFVFEVAAYEYLNLMGGAKPTLGARLGFRW